MSSVPLLPCLYILCPLCHSVFCSLVTLSFTYSVPYVIMASASLLLYLLHTQPLMSLCHSGFCFSVTMSLHSLSLRSLCLPFLCYHVFYILCPLCHYVFRSSVTMSFTYSVPLCLYVILASVPLLLCLYILCPLCLYVILASQM